MIEDMVILLLAGGSSTRLWPLSDKHLLPFLSKPLIWYCLSQISRNRAKKVVLVVSKINKKYIEVICSEFPTLDVTFVVQTDKRSMAGAILSARNEIKGKPLLVVGPSDIYEDSLWISFKHMLHSDPDVIIAGTNVSAYFPGAYLTVDKGYVKSIVEKPKPESVPSNFVSFVFDYFKSADTILSSLEKQHDDRDDIFELALNAMLNEGAKMLFLPYKDYWGYIKYPWHVLNVTGYFLEKLRGNRIKNATVAKSANLYGNIYIEDNVRVMENATIVGPSYIGRGSIIGNNSLVRQSMIGERCVVGYATEIARSWVGNDCWFHTNYVGDCVISKNTALGAGSVVANFRLDEQPITTGTSGKKIETGRVKFGSIIGENVRIGVNSSIMPGVKIGSNCIISAGVCLTRDLPNETFAKYSKQNYAIIANKKETVKSAVRKSVLAKLRF